ncbi:MAG: c-type cytochrome [Rhodobacteraceae bacterium]|nr:c-type cytochrome [Paracoccaceae bacterium]
MRTLVVLIASLAGTLVSAQDFDVFEGHGGPIMSTAMSADGKTALTGSFDNSVGFWDLQTGSVTWLESHEAAVKSTVFLQDGAAASGGDDFAVVLWDLDTATERMRLTGHQGQIKALAYAPERGILASASWDGSIGIWDATTGENLQFLKGHNAPVNDVVFSGRARELYSTSADGTIRFWRLDDPGKGDVIIRHGFGTTEILIDEDADWLAYGAVDGGTRVLSLSTLDEIADLTLERRPILAMAASPDASQIAVGDGEGYIMVVDTASWRIKHDFRAALKGPVWALSYNAQSTALLAGGIDDAAYLWPVGVEAGPLFSDNTRAFLRDPETMSNGERQFQRKCAICHSLTSSSERRAGPTLKGLFGRPAGTVPDYTYSETLDGSDIVWGDATIDALFDLGPDHYIPGTKMPMQRIVAPQDRRDLIAFLRDNT